MSESGEGFDCRSCHERFTDQTADNAGWCRRCRSALVRRAGVWSVPFALLVAAAYLWVLWYFGLFGSTFLIAFVAIGVVLAWVAFKVARRVLFDVLRSRAQRRPA